MKNVPFFPDLNNDKVNFVVILFLKNSIDHSFTYFFPSSFIHKVRGTIVCEHSVGCGHNKMWSIGDFA